MREVDALVDDADVGALGGRRRPGTSRRSASTSASALPLMPDTACPVFSSAHCCANSGSYRRRRLMAVDPVRLGVLDRRIAKQLEPRRLHRHAVRHPDQLHAPVPARRRAARQFANRGDRRSRRCARPRAAGAASDRYLTISSPERSRLRVADWAPTRAAPVPERAMTAARPRQRNTRIGAVQLGTEHVAAQAGEKFESSRSARTDREE